MRMQKMLCSLLANNTVLGTMCEEKKTTTTTQHELNTKA